MRRADTNEQQSYYRFVRYAKGAVGIVFAMAAFFAVINLPEKVTTSHLLVILGMALVAGTMFDAPGMTRLFEMALRALPWTPKDQPPKEDENHGHRAEDA